jgi:hypothetical protein
MFLFMPQTRQFGQQRASKSCPKTRLAERNKDHQLVPLKTSRPSKKVHTRNSINAGSCHWPVHHSGAAYDKLGSGAPNFGKNVATEARNPPVNFVYVKIYDPTIAVSAVIKKDSNVNSRRGPLLNEATLVAKWRQRRRRSTEPLVACEEMGPHLLHGAFEDAMYGECFYNHAIIKGENECDEESCIDNPDTAAQQGITKERRKGREGIISGVLIEVEPASVVEDTQTMMTLSKTSQEKTRSNALNNDKQCPKTPPRNNLSKATSCRPFVEQEHQETKLKRMIRRLSCCKLAVK